MDSVTTPSNSGTATASAEGEGDNGEDQDSKEEDDDDGDDEMIMMVCANQREYMVYDEEDGDESVLLRKVTGGHQEEICVMQYDFHLSLVATGCVNGEITLFDFEMSKVLAIF